MRLAALIALAFAIPASAGEVYLENFDKGSGGWVANRYHPLPIFDGVAYCHGPWYLDSHHAPPGAGYLNMLMYLYTKGANLPPDHIGRKGNAFLDRKMSTNLLNAKLTARLRGKMDMQGAQMVLLVQGSTHGTTANFVLTGQPFRVTEEWSEQTIRLTPDPAQWTCLGARESMKQRYGCAPIEAVLADVNVDIMFVLFPLKVVPVGDVKEPHKLRAGQDYPDEPSYEVQQKYLPKGLVMFDWVRIDYP
ncbi:MAG TPA: hypothetical protein VN442_23155 [Bryobacteraceae bacterium]|nr:hypothetical protein [Bryobacteraceae bacterium]